MSVALGAALLVIAFLLGRETARAPTVVPTAEEPFAPPDRPQSAAADVEMRRWPEWADLEPLETVSAKEAELTPTRIETRPVEPAYHFDGPVDEARPTKRELLGEKPLAPEYFLQMDVIRSEAGAGDPNAFAMDLIKAAMGDSMTGFDQLIADARRMEEEAARIVPPPSCEAYHQANLQALAESREVLEAMRAAISDRDLEALAPIAQKARALQAKVESLQRMREQIVRGSAR